jgi:hypothetical protein
VLTPLCGCDDERASAEQCQAIFNRVVELELQEMGFKDPALAAIRQAELATRHQIELEACVGRRLPPGAMSCVLSAEDTEVLSHDCLR